MVESRLKGWKGSNTLCSLSYSLVKGRQHELLLVPAIAAFREPLVSAPVFPERLDRRYSVVQ
jgi:hypothetical protein